MLAARGRLISAMIAIVNVSTHDDPCGVHEYEVRINREVITRFEHVREDGLAVCLRKAANAVEAARPEPADRMLGVAKSETVAQVGVVLDSGTEKTHAKSNP